MFLIIKISSSVLGCFCDVLPEIWSVYFCRLVRQRFSLGPDKWQIWILKELKSWEDQLVLSREKYDHILPKKLLCSYVVLLLRSRLFAEVLVFVFFFFNLLLKLTCKQMRHYLFQAILVEVYMKACAGKLLLWKSRETCASFSLGKLTLICSLQLFQFKRLCVVWFRVRNCLSEGRLKLQQ